MKRIERDKAIELRKQGFSINEIVQKLGVSKGSVSGWVRDVSLTKVQRERLVNNMHSLEVIEKRREVRLKNERARRQKITDRAKQDYDDIDKEQLKLIGTILYWGEGGKTKRGMVRVTNADPEVIRVMMRYFREVCNVKDKKFRGYIHTFSHTNSEKAERYWSQVSGIPRKQFYKTYTKPSAASKNKRDALPYGTFDIYVCDTKLFLTIMGWIERIKELV